MTSGARWSITPRELARLRTGLDQLADRSNLDSALTALAGWAEALIDAGAIVIALRDGPDRQPIVRAVVGSARRVMMGDRLSEYVANGQSVYRSWLRVPIVLRGQDVGLVLARPRRGRRFDDGDAEVLRLIGAQMAIFIAMDRADVRTVVSEARADAAQAERARLARELHDSTAQQLALASRQLEALRLRGDTSAAGLEELQDTIDHTLVDVRRVSRDLRPELLESLGLRAAVEAHIADAARAAEPRISLRVDGHARPLASQIELALYRIVQEALANALRHAQASGIVVRLAFGERDVMVEVADDGKGLAGPVNYSELVRSGGLGIVGMRERAEEVSGALEINSAPGKGTAVSVRVPVKARV